MSDYYYRLTCPGCRVVRVVWTITELTDEQKEELCKMPCLICQLKKAVKGEKQK